MPGPVARRAKRGRNSTGGSIKAAQRRLDAAVDEIEQLDDWDDIAAIIFHVFHISSEFYCELKSITLHGILDPNKCSGLRAIHDNYDQISGNLDAAFVKYRTVKNTKVVGGIAKVWANVG